MKNSPVVLSSKTEEAVCPSNGVYLLLLLHYFVRSGGFGIVCEPPKSKCRDLKSRLRYSANIDRHSVESNILIKRTKLPNINIDTAAHWSDIFVPIMNCHREKFRFFKFGTNFI